MSNNPDTITLPIPVLITLPAKKISILCEHCRLPVPAGLQKPGLNEQFCCSGCETVFHVLNQCGLEAYYNLREQNPGRRAPAPTTGKNYITYDHPAFIDAYTQKLSDQTRRIEWFLEGLHCAACAWLVEKLPVLMPGISDARLDMGKAILTVVYDERTAKLSAMATQLDRLGYPPHPARGVNSRAQRLAEDRRQLVKVGVAGALAGNVMLVGFALYAGDWSGMEAVYTQWFRWLSMALGTLSLIWPGRVFFKGAWAALRTRTVHLDIPIALGLGVGGVAGLINTITGYGELYFDSLSVLVFLLLVGRYIQRRQQNNADDAVELLFSITPLTARRWRDGRVEEIPVTALELNDCVEVRAGESIPADGTVMDGASSVDQSILTGESIPVKRVPGDPVCAGTVNISAPLRVCVRATGEATRVGKILSWVSECARRKAPTVMLANRIAGWFTLAALTLAAVTYTVWTIKGSTHGADYAIALLIVACPCALGLATPLAVAVALGRAAQRGILIKGGDVLENLAKPGTMLLDKTGTLTMGRATVLNWHGPETLKPLVAALERTSSHPAAQALTRAFENESAHELLAEAVDQKMNGGIEGIVAGESLLIGSQKYIERHGLSIPMWAQVNARACLDANQTPVFIASNGQLRALAGLGDELRPDAKEALDRLRAQGWRIGILSGDHLDIVRSVGHSLKIPDDMLFGGLLPEEKLAHVQHFLRDGTVVMVGDGVNDAAALSAATVGIAVHGGAEASLAAAPVYLSHPGLLDIVELVSASKQTVKAIRRCLHASLFYNALAITLAASGLIQPLIAAILMPISSITVLSISFGSKTFGAPPCR